MHFLEYTNQFKLSQNREDMPSAYAIAASKFKYAFPNDTEEQLNFVLAGLRIQLTFFSKETISSHYLITYCRLMDLAIQFGIILLFVIILSIPDNFIVKGQDTNLPLFIITTPNPCTCISGSNEVMVQGTASD